jgi:energy-coupling factor transporter transmembrane protein EcfT
MDKKTQVMINRIITILLWLLALYLLFFTKFWYLASFIFALHLVELFVIGYQKGRQAGVSPAKTIVLVLLFGFTWWLYLTPSPSSALKK